MSRWLVYSGVDFERSDAAFGVRLACVCVRIDSLAQLSVGSSRCGTGLRCLNRIDEYLCFVRWLRTLVATLPIRTAVATVAMFITWLA